MELRVREFLETNHAAVMTTIKADGRPHVARIGVGLVEGKLWSSGTQTRVRTKHLRRDPRATLFVMGRGAQQWLGLETTVTILDGPDAVEQNLQLYLLLAGRPPDDLDEYRQAMVDEQRLIYEFAVERAYGQY